MPASIDSSGTGYLVFCAIKFAGYSLAASVIARSFPKIHHNAFKVGAARTVIGMIYGGLYYGITYMLSLPTEAFGAGYLFVFPFIRILEWWILLRIFYKADTSEKRNWIIVLLGTLWSFVLDLPASIGYLLTGGLSIC